MGAYRAADSAGQGVAAASAALICRGGQRRDVHSQHWRGAVFPKTCPPKVHDYFSRGPGTARWHPSCALPQMPARKPREASPTACIIDRPEREKRRRSARLRCGQAIKGKKRHVLVDTQGLLLHGSSPPLTSSRRRPALPSLFLFPS